MCPCEAFDDNLTHSKQQIPALFWFNALLIASNGTDNWTFVVVTDHVELNDQGAKTFKATGAVTEAECDQCHAGSGAHLRELIMADCVHATASATLC